MSRLGTNIIYVFCAILLLGSVGWVFARWRLTKDIAAVRNDSERELDRLRKENRQRRQNVQAAPSGPAISMNRSMPPTESDDVTRRAGIVSDWFRSGLLGGVSWPRPDRNSLQAAMTDVASILGLNSVETAALQRIADVGKMEFGNALRTHAIVEQAGSTVTITVKDEPDLHATYERMLSSVKDVLGPKRFDSFETFGAEEAIATLYDRWGLNGTVLKVAHSTVVPETFSVPKLDKQGNPVPGSNTNFAGDPLGRRLYYYTTNTPGQPGQMLRGNETLTDLEIDIGPIQKLLPADF